MKQKIVELTPFRGYALIYSEPPPVTGLLAYYPLKQSVVGSPVELFLSWKKIKGELSLSLILLHESNYSGLRLRMILNPFRLLLGSFSSPRVPMKCIPRGIKIKITRQ